MADIIDELSGMDDAALISKFGFDKKVEDFRSDLKEAATLTGDAREKVVRELENAFQPRDYVMSELKWSIDSAKRKAKTGSSPKEIVDCCCGD